MNPLVQGLFNSFREAHELDEVAENDAFELFAASLVLGPGIVNQAELTDFLLDPSNPGIDTIAILANGQLVWDESDVTDVCSDVAALEVELHFIQAKRGTSVKSSEILALGHNVKKFLNGEVDPEFERTCLLAKALKRIFEDYAAILKQPPSIHMRYFTTAQASAFEEPEVSARSESARSDVVSLGFVGDVEIDCIGADDIHQLHLQQTKANEADIEMAKQISLPAMQGVDQALVGLITLEELLKMIMLDNGLLDEGVFYDNVRGFQGQNPVNRRISETLASGDRDLLPVLNNGVTVVAREYHQRPGDRFTLSDYQIVNGCQTSHCVYLAREELGSAASEVQIPVRLVITGDADVASQIIRATNSQTEVTENQLVALSQFQKRLEDYYKLDQSGVGLTYERRAGQFYGKQVVQTRLVTIADQVRAVAAVFLNLPHLSIRYPSKLFEEVGDSLFQNDHRFEPYVASAFASYRLENAFRIWLDSKYKPVRYHTLTALRYQVAAGKPAPLNSKAAEDDAKKLVEALKGAGSNDIILAAAQAVESVDGGIPSRDRLKRPAFTADLVKALT